MTGVLRSSVAQWLGDGKRADGFEDWLHETLALGHNVKNSRKLRRQQEEIGI